MKKEEPEVDESLLTPEQKEAYREPLFKKGWIIFVLVILSVLVALSLVIFLLPQ